jgi:hypothetical protein
MTRWSLGWWRRLSGQGNVKGRVEGLGLLDAGGTGTERTEGPTGAWRSGVRRGAKGD